MISNQQNIGGVDIDPGVVKVMKAIRSIESQGDYNARGDGGAAFGAFQYNEQTGPGWKNIAKQYLGDDKAPMDKSNQNKATYLRIKQWKDEGLQPEEIAARWNGAYKDKDGRYQYNNPDYGDKFRNALQLQVSEDSIKNRGAQVGQEQKGTFLQDAGKSLTETGSNVADVVGRTGSGQINLASGLLQGAGAIAGGINSLTGDVLHHTPVVGGLVEKAEGLVGKGVEKALDTDIGKAGLERYERLAENHPEVAGNLGAGLEIASAIPVLKGLGVAKNVAKGGIKSVLKGSTDDILEAVAKDLGPKGRAKALVSRGTEKKGLLGEVKLKPDAREIEYANSVRRNVPTFDPSNPLKNVEDIKVVVKDMAKELKDKVRISGGDRIYPKRELISRLRNIDRPDLLSSDAVLDGAYNRLVNRLESMLSKRPGRVDDLLDLRKEFDAIVAKQYPDLYSSERLTPLRQAVSDVREEITDFTAKNLPDGGGFRESLLEQHRLLRAMENIAEKATKGSGSELGTNAIGRFGQRHPLIKGLVKTGGKLFAEGTGVGTVLRLMD